MQSGRDRLGWVISSGDEEEFVNAVDIVCQLSTLHFNGHFPGGQSG